MEKSLSPVDSAQSSATPQVAWSPRKRLIIYAVVLTVLGSIVCFYGLGDGMMGGDEALYATVMDNMWESGDWIQPMVRPGRTHLHKPPLYYWFSATTHGLLEPDEFRYRFWAAIFAIGCVLLTALLGTLMFSPEIGFIGGLVLLGNRNFILVHSARSGTFDTGLVFFILGSLICYWHFARGPRPRLGWILTGLCAGAACLFKPFVVSCCMLGITTLHHLATERDLWRRYSGPLLGWSICLLIMAPWHVVMWCRLGDEFFLNFFGANIVVRAATGLSTAHVEPPYFYLQSIADSSRSFRWLAWPALGAASVAAVIGWRRREFAWLAFSTAAFVAVLSASASKLITYPYPVYPLFALLIAATLFSILPTVLRRWLPYVDRRVWFASALIAVSLFLYADAKLLHRRLTLMPVPYGPLALSERVSAQKSSGAPKIVLCEFPTGNERKYIKHRAADLFYSRYLPAALRVPTLTAIPPLLESGEPILVVCSPMMLSETIDELRQIRRPDAEGKLPTHEGESLTVLSYGKSFAQLGIEKWMNKMGRLVKQVQDRAARESGAWKQQK